MREYKEFELINKDIQYKEGILEILEEKNRIDLLILSNNLPGEIDFKTLINIIINTKKELEIIVFLREKDINIEQFLNSKKIYKIYYLDSLNYDLFITKVLKVSAKSEENIAEEIKEFKSLIYQKNNIKKHKNIQKNMVVILGNAGVGKTLFSHIFSEWISSKNKKILLIEYDNNYSILKEKDTKNILVCGKTLRIDSINKNLFIIKYFSKIINNLNILEGYKIQEILSNLKTEYDFIFLDTSLEVKYTENLLKKTDKILYLLEPNLLEIKKAELNLEILNKDFNFKKINTKIILNKCNKYSVSDTILNEFFEDYEVIGKIKYDEKYTNYINNGIIKNYNEYREYEKIYKKINI